MIREKLVKELSFYMLIWTRKNEKLFLIQSIKKKSKWRGIIYFFIVLLFFESLFDSF